jgi:hypothetical protein
VVDLALASNEKLHRKNLNGDDLNLIGVVAKHFPEGTEENQDKPQLKKTGARADIRT